MTLQNTAHPSPGVIQDKPQILIQVYPNVIFNIPYTLGPILCMGLWPGQAGEAVAGQAFQTVSIKANSPSFGVGRMSHFHCREMCSPAF